MPNNPMKLRQKGSVSLSYLALLIPMVVAAAATIVIGYQVQLSNRATQAVDAASLACAFAGTADKNMNQRYLDFYRPKVVGVTAEPDMSSGCKVKMGYRLNSIFTSLTLSNTSFVASANSSELVRVEPSVSSSPTELVVVLDISGSMSSSITALKQILNNALTSLKNQQAQANSRDHIKLSVVPFADGVSVNNAPWLPQAGVFCVDGLTKQGDNVSASETVSNLDASHDKVSVDFKAPNQWLADCSATSPLLPLTSDLDVVANHIDGLAVTGGTASYQGLIWGIRQLTPNWQKDWGVTSRSSTSPTRKLVLMTDGADSNDTLDQLISAGLCDKASNTFGIQLNFIGFNVLAPRLEQFRRCAQSGSANSGKVFQANSTEELNEYFEQILKLEYETVLNFGNK